MSGFFGMVSKADCVEEVFYGTDYHSHLGTNGYQNEKRIPYKRAYSKYTPSWPRSFMPQNQNQRDLVAKMKLIPNKAVIEGKRQKIEII
jgi:amidophosphoribosyltransferase